jgi:tetratricopeptide (TPR) repeat protein
MIRVLAAIAASLCLSQDLHAVQLDMPAAAAQDPFARQQLSARSAALGVAFEPLSDGMDALDENPAGLAQAKTWGLGLHQHSYLLDLSQQGAVVAGPWQSWGLGLGGRYLNYGAFDDRDGNGVLTGHSQVADFAGRLGAAHSLWSGADAGLTLGMGTQKVAGNAPVFSLAAGLQTRLGPLWRAGVSTGYRMAANGVAGGLEALRAGLAWSPLKGDIQSILALGASLEEAGQLRLGAGAELSYQAYVVRASFQTKPGNEDVDALGQWSLGFGLNEEDLRLDYAFRPLGDLGTDNRFSVSFLMPDAAQTAAATENAGSAWLWQPGTWQLSVHGGAARYLPYSAEDLESLFKITGASTDFSPATAAFGGVSVGMEMDTGWLTEIGTDVLALRRFHVRQVFSGALSSDIDENMQPLLFYASASYRWRLASGWSVSAGLQGGYGYLLTTLTNELPSLGLKSTVTGSSSGYSAMPLVRLEHQLGQTQSLGVELGYRLLSFGQSSGGSSSIDIGNFSGFNLALRWALAVKRGLAPTAEASPFSGSDPEKSRIESSQRWRALGDLRLKEGNRDKAREAYKKALAADPKDPDLPEIIWNLEDSPAKP